MKKYQALLFHPQGDYVYDFTNSETISDVWEQIEEMGSRWVFYPIIFVATDKTIVATLQGLEFLKGKRIKTVVNFLKKEWAENEDRICAQIFNNIPFNEIY